MSTGRQLRKRLEEPEILILPGAANALTARVIEDAGMEAVYVTGAGVANTFFALPDIGLVTLRDLVEHVSAIAGAVDIPLVVDADTGFGNAVSVRHTVRALEHAGANAIQLEDQTFPKRCGHFAGKEVVPKSDMVSKVRAAVDARRDDDFLIIARTDARGVEGLDAAIERAIAYREVGADILFVEAPVNVDEMRRIGAEVPGPLLANLVRGGATPEVSQADLADMGFNIALYANFPLLAQISAVKQAVRALQADDLSANRVPVATWDERQRLVGKHTYDDLERRYAVPQA